MEVTFKEIVFFCNKCENNGELGLKVMKRRNSKFTSEVGGGGYVLRSQTQHWLNYRKGHCRDIAQEGNGGRECGFENVRSARLCKRYRLVPIQRQCFNVH